MYVILKCLSGVSMLYYYYSKINNRRNVIDEILLIISKTSSQPILSLYPKGVYGSINALCNITIFIL